MVWSAAACPSGQNCPNRSAGSLLALSSRSELYPKQLTSSVIEGHPKAIIDCGLALGISEQVRQKLLHALHGVKKLIHAGSFPSDLVVGEIGNDGIAQLCGAPDALADEQRKQRLRIVACDLALLPLLNGPGGLADVIHGVAEIRHDALIDAAGADGMLELQQLGTGFL